MFGGLEELRRQMEEADPFSLAEAAGGTGCFLIVDVINGFLKEGALANPGALSIVGPLGAAARAAAGVGWEVVALRDEHQTDSPEFASYPPHCLAGNREAALVDELADIPLTLDLPKNSTNGLMEPAFEAYLREHPKKVFVLTGVCTDICILQLALSLKTWHEAKGRAIRVILPKDMVDTFDLPGHSRELYTLMACALMRQSGVEICGGITD